MKALAVVSALACGWFLPLGTGLLLWCLLSVPVGLLVGRLLRRNGRD